jgi:hypothetical protein
MPPCVIVGERDGNGITACGGYSSGDFDAKPLLMMMFVAPLLLLLLLFVVVVVVLCSCFPKKAIFFSLETNPEFKDPIPRLVGVERSFFEPNREILVLVVSVASLLSEVTIVRTSRRRRTTGDDDDDGVVDVVEKVGCVFDIIIRIIIIVSIVDISRRPLLFVAAKARKKDDGIKGAIVLTPFFPVSSSLSFSLSLSLSLDPTKSVSLMMMMMMMRAQKVDRFYYSKKRIPQRREWAQLSKPE